MLKSVLSGEQCAKCRICCSFVKGDVWEAPAFDQGTVSVIKDHINGKDIEFSENGDRYRAVYNFKNDQDILLCPGLDETNGCVLGENKPFECKLWPLRVFEANGHIAIGVASVCPAFSEINDDKLTELLNGGLYSVILKEAEKNPGIIKEKNGDYRIIYRA